jgi:hypothetical protein
MAISLPVSSVSLDSDDVSFTDFCAKHPVVLEVKSLMNDGFAGLGSFGAQFRMFDAPTNGEVTYLPEEDGVPGFHLITDASIPLWSLMISPTWSDYISSTSARVIAVCGSRNMGKSMLAKCLMNSLQDRPGNEGVLYLETDLGQSEFTPGGIVGLYRVTEPLLGPAFCHTQTNETTICQFFVGHTCPDKNPAYYFRAIAAAFKFYQDMPVKPPLIINTHGWTTGLGWEMVLEILCLTRPDEIVAMSDFDAQGGLDPQSRRNLNDLLGNDPSQFLKSRRHAWFSRGVQKDRHGDIEWKPRVCPLPSVEQFLPVKPRKSSSDHRCLNTISYFCSQPANMTDFDPSTRKWDFTPITSRIPVYARYDTVRMCVLDSPLRGKLILEAMNASLVALCCDDRPRKSMMMPPMDFLHGSSELHGQCLSLAIVRSCEPSGKDRGLYIQLPLRHHPELARALMIVKGSVSVPNVLAYHDETLRDGPYADDTLIDGISANQIRRPRRNLLRHRLNPGQG